MRNIIIKVFVGFCIGITIGYSIAGVFFVHFADIDNLSKRISVIEERVSVKDTIEIMVTSIPNVVNRDTISGWTLDSLRIKYFDWQKNSLFY